MQIAKLGKKQVPTDNTNRGASGATQRAAKAKLSETSTQDVFDLIESDTEEDTRSTSS